MLCPGFLAKSRTMNHHHMLLPNEFLDENFVTLRNIAIWKMYARKSVERSARRNTTHARRRFAPLLRKVATGTQLAPHVQQVILRTLPAPP